MADDSSVLDSLKKYHYLASPVAMSSTPWRTSKALCEVLPISRSTLFALTMCGSLKAVRHLVPKKTDH